MDLGDRQTFILGLTYIIFRRWVLIVVMFLAVMALFLFAAYLITPTWEAEVLLLAEAPPQPSLSAFGGSTSPPPADATENLATTLSGKGIATDMVKQFGLDERTRLRAQEPPTLRDAAKVFIMQVIMSPITFLQWVGLMEKGEVDWVDKAVEDFREGLTSVLDVKALPNSQVVSLKINGETPELAMNIANAMVQRVRERLAEATARGGKDTREAYRKELTTTKEKLDDAEARLKAFEVKQGGGSLSDDLRLKTENLQELVTEDSRLRAEIEVLGRQLEEAGRAPERTASINSEATAQNPVVQALRSSLHAQEGQLAVLITERTADHPDVINLREQIASLRESLREEITNVYRVLVANQVRTQAQITDQQKALLALPGRELVLAELSMSVATYRQLYQQLLQSTEELEVLAQSGLAALDFKVLDSAYVSPLHSSDFPNWLIVIAVGVVVAAGSGFGLALLVEYWRDPVKGAGDLRLHQIEVLGVVPHLSERSRRAG